MEKPFRVEDREVVKELERCVKELEKQARNLEKLGRGIPVVEKNACCILSIINVLGFGISDIAEIYRKADGNRG